MSEGSTVATAAGDERPGTVGSYVYGIIAAGVAVPEGLTPIPREGADPELGLITHGELAAVVSDVAADRTLGTRRDLMAHEEVLNAVARETPVLPMRFGGVVTDDDAVADELLAPHHDYFVWALEQMAGKTEFSLRGEYDVDAMVAGIVGGDDDLRALSESIRGADEDATYYDRIRLGEAIQAGFDRQRQQDAAAAVDALGRFAVASEVQEPRGEGGAVRIAFLIPSDHTTDFEQAVDALGDEWGGRVSLRLVGPTAPYDFLPEMPAPPDATSGEAAE